MYFGNGPFWSVILPVVGLFGWGVIELLIWFFGKVSISWG